MLCTRKPIGYTNLNFTCMKKFLIYLLAFLVLIQLYRPAKNSNETSSPNNIAQVIAVPDDVQKILERSCYDCHSNNTQYLWYHEIAPMSWGVAYHIAEGKKHLNYDEFATYNKRQQAHALEETSEVVEKGEMPLKGYVAFHPETKLSEDDIQKIRNWVVSTDLKE